MRRWRHDVIDDRPPMGETGDMLDRLGAFDDNRGRALLDRCPGVSMTILIRVGWIELFDVEIALQANIVRNTPGKLSVTAKQDARSTRIGAARDVVPGSVEPRFIPGGRHAVIDVR